jgi:regulator of sirC expression with transglutaminase-like and TPR domain
MGDSNSDAFSRLLRGDNGALTLDLVALVVARIEFPHLQAPEIVAPLDRLAAEVRARMRHGFRLAAERRLFEELSFAGNEVDYYNPLNSCLNWVLDSKLGIPISLSVLYMEVARRLDVRVDGIAAPGHFLIRLEEDGDTYYLDPFRGGIIREDLESEIDPQFLNASPPRAIAIRMLNNLRQIYLERRVWAKAEAVLNWLLTAEPRDGDALRQRSAARAGQHRYKASAADLEQYLKLFPQVQDADDLNNQLLRLKRMHASQN